MLTIKVDPHTHTLFSGHAFSTIGENVTYAASMGLEAIGMADHFSPHFTPAGKNGPSWGGIMNMPALPRIISGVTVLASVEIDIVDLEGRLAFWDCTVPKEYAGGRDISVNTPLLESRDYAIASVHGFPGSRDGSRAQNTKMYCSALENPYIHIIGHPGRAGLRFDIDEVCRTAKALGKMLEINDHSFDSDTDVTDECRRIALRCAELETKVVVSSDAHSAWFVGHFERALAMLEEIHFPPELIANRTLEGFLQTIQECAKKPD